MNNYIDSILNLYNNTTIIINLDDKKIKKFFIANKSIANDISIDEFAILFKNTFNLNDKSKDKIIRFLTNLNPLSEKFNINAEYETIYDEKTTFLFTGQIIDHSNVLITISTSVIDIYNDSDIDYLTKVLTKKRIDQLIENDILNNKQFSLALVDLDDFKSFNEEYGKMYGDIMLIETAASIKKFLGKNGVVARIDKDRFLLLLYINNNYDEIHKACADIKKAIENISKNNVKKAPVTATIGLASFPNDGKTYDEIYYNVNKALIRGKNKRRNCFIIYDEFKCKDVVLDKTEIYKKSDNSYKTSNNYTIIAGVNEILSREGSISKNIEDALSLIGNFFGFDRTILMVNNLALDNIKNTYIWRNPLNELANKELVLVSKEGMEDFRNALDNLGVVKFSQVDSNKNSSIYKYLVAQNTTALIGFELSYANNKLGFLRLDMCSKNRFLNPDDTSCLIVISKIFTTYLNKLHETDIHKYELYHDKLTKLYIFTRFRDLLYERSHNRTDLKYTILSLDFKSFSSLNSIYGTKYCDNALILLAQTLNETRIDNSLFCRVTEDRFLVYLPYVTEDEVNNYYNNLNDIFQKKLNNDSFKIICGAYIHTNNDEIGTSIDKANLARKDNKMGYGVTFFSDELFNEFKFKEELKLHMLEAKNNDEFLLYLQPKFNTQTGKMVGAEALTRWYYKHEKMIFPNVFIPLFEQNGFITELDYHVFENVCRFQREVIDNGLEPIVISVNVSRYQTNFNQYLKRINEIREKYQLSADIIEIEITEGMYVDKTKEIADFINELHTYGYSVSMDDFGSGYSNLRSLADLDFDMIKLDKGFCDNKDDKKESIILNSIMELAKKLNMNVLCEGVETESFLNYLKEIGCTIVQGYYFDKPIPKEDFYNKYIKK